MGFVLSLSTARWAVLLTVSLDERGPFSVQDPAVSRDGHNLPGNELAAVSERGLRGPLQAAAAGYVHAHDGHAFDVVVPDDRRQLFKHQIRVAHRLAKVDPDQSVSQRPDDLILYLVQNGIGAERIQTRSYGEERPAAQGNDESAWSKNRRSEFVVFRK